MAFLCGWRSSTAKSSKSSTASILVPGDGGMIIGIDVGGTNARALLIDSTSGDIVDRVAASSAGDGETLTQTLVAQVHELELRNGIAADAVGLGIAGLIDRTGVVRYSPNLPDIIEFPIGLELQGALRIPVAVGNDATTGAWAEAKLGAGRGTDDFVFVALGTGIGTGIVANGKLLTGARGFAGESGHMTIDADGPLHITGRPGPWEYFGSGNALGRLAREAAARGEFQTGVDITGGSTAISGIHVTNALDDDDQAKAIFDAFCRQVAIGTANLIAILDPERIVLGGGLADIGEPLRAGVESWLGDLVTGADHRPQVEVALAELGSDAGALGAALMAAELD
jgi:glucokinase